MSRRIKVLISVLAAVVLLTVGSAATVMAEGEATPPEAGAKCIPARVAQILGISQEDLTNAFEQARQEMREEALIRVLDRAVEKGRIDEDEAKEIEEWWEQRPEVQDRSRLRRAFGFPPLGGGQVQQRHAHAWRTSAKYGLE